MDQSPIDELKRLDEQVEHVSDLTGLKPIFYRLEEISKQSSGDFDVQLVVADVKQHLVNKGMRLKEALSSSTQTQPSYDTGSLIPQAPTTSPLSSTTGSRTVTPTTANPFGTQKFGATTGSNPAIVPPPSAESTNPNLTPPPATRAVSSGTDQIPAAQGAMPLTTSQMSTATPPPPPPVQPPAAKAATPKASGPNWQRSAGIGAAIGLVLFAGFIAVVQVVRHKNGPVPSATVPVDISTTPPGASIRINNEVRCTSNCSLNLAAGNYTITALLDGYEPAASGVTVTAGSTRLPVTLTLQPQAQTVRLFADEPGKVVLDDQPPRDLQDGQLILDGVKNGKHVVKVDTKSGQSTFSFEVVAGKPPVIDGPVTAKNIVAVLVSGSGGQAHLATSASALKVALDGQPKGEAGLGGLDLTSVTPGDHQLAIGEGKDQKTLVVSFGPAPMLTAFLKSDVNTGTLVVVSGEDDATVFLNGREQRLKTQRGQMRIPWLGIATVRVAKPGFQEVAEQKVTVKKGEEQRVEFALKPLPKFASLQIRGATPGITVFIDDKSAGTVGPDGGLSRPNIAPGEHTVELRHDRFSPKKLSRTFKAGETVALNGPDVILSAATGTVQVTVVPASATVVYRRADDPQTHDVKGSVQLEKGVYTFIARAAGFNEKSERVVILAGDSRSIDFRLEPAKVVPPPPPPPKNGTMADWQSPAQWANEDGMFVHRGAGAVLYKPEPAGTYSFTVKLLKGGGAFKGNHIRWFVNWKDAKTYALFDLEKKNFTPKDVVNAKGTNHGDNHPHDEAENYAVEVTVLPDRVTNRIQGEVWDNWQQPGRNFADGVFGFLVQGNEEIGITNFKFVPAPK